MALASSSAATTGRDAFFYAHDILVGEGLSELTLTGRAGAIQSLMGREVCHYEKPYWGWRGVKRS